MSQLSVLKNELNQNISKLKTIEQERLIKEMQTKEEYKSLMEIEEKVKKDEDRKRKMEDELNTLRNNLLRENSNKETMDKEILGTREQIENLQKTITDKEAEKDKNSESIK